jgi:hypothetical protein
MTIILAALAAALGAAWGALWGLTRDQNQPSWADRKPSFSGWKECGIVLLGLPLALIAGWKFGPIEAAVIWAGMAGAWAMGHMGGLGLRFAPSRTGLSIPMSYGAMFLTGALVTLAPAGVLVWHGGLLAALPPLLAGGVGKVAAYEAAYLLRGLGDDRPHAGTIGAMAHGAIAVGVATGAMVVS